MANAATKPIATKTATKPIATKTATKPVATKTATKPVATKTATKPVATKTATKPEKVKKANGSVKLIVFPKTQFKDLPDLKTGDLAELNRVQKAMLEEVKKAGKPISLSELKTKVNVKDGRLARTACRYAHKCGIALLYQGEGNRFYLGAPGEIVKTIEVTPIHRPKAKAVEDLLD